jgi:hypothetical protein
MSAFQDPTTNRQLDHTTFGSWNKMVMHFPVPYPQLKGERFQCNAYSHEQRSRKNINVRMQLVPNLYWGYLVMTSSHWTVCWRTLEPSVRPLE